MESGKIRNFQDLETWREGHRLVLEIYKITRRFPREELFGLTSQLRRCSVSITSNIAEGFGRQSGKEKIQFYFLAHGSVYELQNQITVARDVGYISGNEYESLFSLSIKVHKLVNGLIKSIRKRFLVP